MEFSCSASIPQFTFFTCILFYKEREERSGMEVGRVERLGRETVGKGSCRREGAETGRSSALGQQYLLQHTSVTRQNICQDLSCENGSLLLLLSIRCWECFSLGVYFVCNFVSQQCVCVHVCMNLCVPLLTRNFKCLFLVLALCLGFKCMIK